MKKSFHILAIGFAVLMVFTGAAMAGTSTVTNATVTAPNAPTAYPDLTGINMSPNVQLGYCIFQDSFAVAGWNENGTIEYGLCSADANIYFQPTATTKTAVTQPSFTATAESSTAFSGSTWAVLGGS